MIREKFKHRALSTGQVATVTGLSQQTVIRCIDKGDLIGFRVPLSRFRRVTRKEVTAWATRHKLELHWDRLTEEMQ